MLSFYLSVSPRYSFDQWSLWKRLCPKGARNPKCFTARCYASAVLAMALCPSVSVTSRCSIETAERIELVLACELPSTFHPSYTVLKGNLVISKNKGTSLWNFVLNSELRRKFRHGISIVETCYQHSSRKKDAQSVINWAVVGQLSR